MWVTVLLFKTVCTIFTIRRAGKFTELISLTYKECGLSNNPPSLTYKNKFQTQSNEMKNNKKVLLRTFQLPFFLEWNGKPRSQSSRLFTRNRVHHKSFNSSRLTRNIVKIATTIPLKPQLLLETNNHLTVAVTVVRQKPNWKILRPDSRMMDRPWRSRCWKLKFLDPFASRIQWKSNAIGRSLIESATKVGGEYFCYLFFLTMVWRMLEYNGKK